MFMYIHTHMYIHIIGYLSSSLGGRGGAGAGSGRRGMIRKRDYTPVTWDKYFDKMENVETSKGDVSFITTRACVRNYFSVSFQVIFFNCLRPLDCMKVDQKDQYASFYMVVDSQLYPGQCFR